MKEEAMSEPAGRWALRAPEAERPVEGETRREARDRQARNRHARAEWQAFRDARCAECGMVRYNVVHEMDPENSPEGPEYHADFAHHPFRESQP